MLKLDITHDCLKFLRSLDSKQFRQVVTTLFRLLGTPEPQDSSALSGFAFRRVDIGEYRIIYRVEGDHLKVPLIGKRNDDAIYKALRRLPQRDPEDHPGPGVTHEVQTVSTTTFQPSARHEDEDVVVPSTTDVIQSDFPAGH